MDSRDQDLIYDTLIFILQCLIHLLRDTGRDYRADEADKIIGRIESHQLYLRIGDDD